MAKRDGDMGLPKGGFKGGMLKGLTGKSPSWEDGSGHKGGGSVNEGLVRSEVGRDEGSIGPRSA